MDMGGFRKNSWFKDSLWAHERDPNVVMIETLGKNLAGKYIPVHGHLLRQPVECLQSNLLVEGFRVH